MATTWTEVQPLARLGRVAVLALLSRPPTACPLRRLWRSGMRPQFSLQLGHCLHLKTVSVAKSRRPAPMSHGTGTWRRSAHLRASRVVPQLFRQQGGMSLRSRSGFMPSWPIEHRGGCH